MDQAVRHYANAGIEESILEGNHHCYEDVFILLSIEHFFNFFQFSLDQIVISQAAQVLHRQLICLGIIDDVENPVEEKFFMPLGIADQRWLFSHGLMLLGLRRVLQLFLKLIIVNVYRLVAVIVVLDFEVVAFAVTFTLLFVKGLAHIEQ